MLLERDAAKALQGYFYEWRDLPGGGGRGPAEYFRAEAGDLVLPCRASMAEMRGHRDRLIGRDFRFTRLPCDQTNPSARRIE